MPACRHYQEWRADPDEPWEAFYEPRLRVVDGTVTVPDRPGWGVTIMPEFLRVATARASDEG